MDNTLLDKILIISEANKYLSQAKEANRKEGLCLVLSLLVVLGVIRYSLKEKLKEDLSAYSPHLDWRGYYWKRNWYGYLIRRYVLNKLLIKHLFFKE